MITIPKGWRKLRAGVRLKPTDQFYYGPQWRPTCMTGQCVGALGAAGPYIRRIRKASRSLQKGEKE